MQSKHLIKKYGNRKLYDTNQSRYITLNGIEKLVNQGHDIQVIERETGRDITPFILSQLVMTEERRQAGRAGEGLQRGQALLDYVRRTLNVPAALVSEEVGRRRDDLEAMVDLAISRALRRLSIPTRRDLERINRRLDEINARLASLGQGLGAEPGPVAGGGVARGARPAPRAASAAPHRGTSHGAARARGTSRPPRTKRG